MDKIIIEGIAVIMRRALLCLLIVECLSTTGCDTFQKKHDNPVMVAAPRRVEPDQLDETESKYVDNRDTLKMPKEYDGIEQTSVSSAVKKNPWEGWKDDTTIFNSQVAATVNGVPVLNGDVIDRYAGYLLSVREQMQLMSKNAKPGQQAPTPDDYEKLRYTVIQREISVHIQKKLLVEYLKSGFKAEQLKLMNDHVDQLFEREIEKLKKDLKVSNKTELEIELNKKGTTLKNVRDNFALDELSKECVALKSEKADPIDRADMVSYYQTNVDKFLITAKVKWEQIQISITPEVSKKAALKKLEQAISELNSGVPFEKVARKYSNGPTAKDGGIWDWMEPGNLKDANLEKKLFTMPLNKLSDIHESDDSVCVVRVTARQPDSRKPFKDVQDEIRALLEAERNKNRPKKLFKKIFSNAVIETQYTLPQFDTDG